MSVESRGKGKQDRKMPLATWIILGTLIVGIGCFALALMLPLGTLSHPDHGLLPAITGVLLIASSTVSLLELRKASTKSLPAAEESQPTATEKGSETSWMRPLLILGAIFVYFFLAGLLGHVLAAALVAIIVLRTAGMRQWWQVGVYGTLIGLSSWLLFDVLLRVRLPRGLIF